MPVPFRLGFAVKILGEGGLATADTRRWQSGPHLRRSIELLHAAFDYLERTDVRVYRMSSQVIPYGTHPDLPHLAYERQLGEAAETLEPLAGRARSLGLRLSTHPGQYTVMNALDGVIVDKALHDLEQDALLLDALDQGPEGTIVIHVGGLYGDRAAALDRWVRAWDRLSPRAKARVGLENDERLFGLEDVLRLHERTGVRVVLDVHHLRVHPADARVPLADAMTAAFATWAPGVRPKVHLSSARVDLAGVREGAAVPARPPYPKLAAHADLVAPWDLAATVSAAPAPFDVMIEAKAKDLAVRWLREVGPAVIPETMRAEERTRA